MARAPRKKKPTSAKKARVSRARSKAAKAAAPSPLLLPAQAASVSARTSRPPSSRRARQLGRWSFVAACSILAGLIAAGLITNTHWLQTASPARPHATTTDSSAIARATSRLHQLSGEVASLETAEEIDDSQVISDTSLDRQLSQIQSDITHGWLAEAQTDMNQLAGQLTAGRAQLASLHPPAPTITASGATLTVPILVYHKTPSDFGAQLDTLEQKNYHAITMAQLTAALHNLGGLPPKPVVITFDDGFADQMQAFSLLQQHHMVATFYIIDGGSESQWCIGAGRRYNDPLQPPTGCGDAYLSWDQVRQLDRSGIITIGSHTIDHPNLATETPAEQTYEIVQGKQELEAQLGHPVYDFAYPYGNYNATTLSIVQQAGFATAVTTTASTTQSLGGIYTLGRVRDPSTLP